MGLRVKRYGPLSTMVVVGRLVGTFEPALVIVTMAQLIARAGKSPEPHPLEAVVCLQVCEAHLNTLSLVSGFGKRLCLHFPSCDVACILMDVARDLARISRGAGRFPGETKMPAAIWLAHR